MALAPDRCIVGGRRMSPQMQAFCGRDALPRVRRLQRRFKHKVGQRTGQQQRNRQDQLCDQPAGGKDTPRRV